MSATDELRRMLDERGVPYETNDDMGASETRWNGFTAYQLTPNAKLVMHPTPEQAIAATLGSEREAELIRAIEDVLRHSTDTVWAGEVETLVDRMVSLGVYGHDVYEGARPWEAIAAWNTRAEHGTLTAEQVRECVEKHWHDLPDEYDMPEATALPEYSYDWQAITDELNSRAERTCKKKKGGGRMNREQAENILEAYINMECGGGDNKARQSLREVILDAMTEYRVKSNYPSITYPYATWNEQTKTYKPTITCGG